MNLKTIFRACLLPLALADPNAHAAAPADPPGHAPACICHSTTISPTRLADRSRPALGQPASDPTHTANFGVKLQEHLRTLGVPCELVYPGAPDVKHPELVDYVLARFGTK